ncbi:exoribonuclease-2 [Candidatus Electrothrix communis]|uniref:Exoribonuclease-2 n=1 Tax=Candidatus Electrothrix communis TaxID=1859133 RepID=A0A3S3UD55_9BACT|nr:exoribonuclease-2 [Candidatus Electrothrix communis]
MFESEAEQADVVRQLLKKAELHQPHQAYHLLVRAGVWERDMNLPLLRAEQPVDFTPELLAHAESIKEPTAEELLKDPKRKDFRDMNPDQNITVLKLFHM